MENASEDPNAPGALMLPPGEIERWVRDFHWVAGRRDWLDEIQAQLDKDFKCELEAMALAPPRERGKGKLSFQNLSHFVEEAIVARDWLE